MKAYYAHFMGTYNTPVEERDVKTLEGLGFEIINPNTPETQEIVKKHLEENGDYAAMFRDVFFSKIADSEVFAFRSLPDGLIPAGVAKELEYAREFGKLIIEIPCGLTKRSLGVKETREYLTDMGER